MIEPSDLPWQLRTTSCQMMGRVLINNTGSDWLPAGSSRVRYTESREQWFWLQTTARGCRVVVRTEGGEGVKRGWFRHGRSGERRVPGWVTEDGFERCDFRSRDANFLSLNYELETRLDSSRQSAKEWHWQLIAILTFQYVYLKESDLLNSYKHFTMLEIQQTRNKKQHNKTKLVINKRI